jgi:hypothetical protein
MVRRLALWLLYLLPACSESILCPMTETCRSIEICNKYTKSAFVGSCYLDSYEDARKTFSKKPGEGFAFCSEFLIMTFIDYLIPLSRVLFEKLIVPRLVNDSPPQFMEPEASLPSSQQRPFSYPEPD